MDILNFILIGFSLATSFGAAAATFYGVRNKTIITTLKESNDAYKDQNAQLKEEKVELKKQLDDTLKRHTAEINDLKGRIGLLEKMKTPPFEPMMKLMHDHHVEVMEAIQGA